MKVLIVDESFHSGRDADSYARELGSELTRQNCQVEYFSLKNREEDSLKSTVSNASFEDLCRQGARAIASTVRNLEPKEAYRRMKELIESFCPDVIHLVGIDRLLTPPILRAASEEHIPAVLSVQDGCFLYPERLMSGFAKKGSEKEHLADSAKTGSRMKEIFDPLAKSASEAMEGFCRESSGLYDSISTVIVPSRFLESLYGNSLRFHGKTIFLRRYVKEYGQKTSEHGRYVFCFGSAAPENALWNLIEAAKELPDADGKVQINARLTDASSELMPATGGSGTAGYWAAGTLCILLAVFWILKEKAASAENR